MDILDYSERVKKIKLAYNVLNRSEGYKSWGVTEYLQVFQGDVGDLAKLILASRGFAFSQKDVEVKIARELADCLWSVLVLADELDVNIQQEFNKMLLRLEDKIQDRKVTKPKAKTV